MNIMRLPTSPEQMLLPWLTHQSSLTEKLKFICENTTLQLLNQAWVPPCWWIKYTLKNPQNMLQRNILMLAQDTPCWFARTLVPVESYKANREFFERLEKESLGNLVFNEPTIERIGLSHYAINASCIEYYWLPKDLRKNNSTLWLRYSQFVRCRKYPFYLMEILLPDLLRISHEIE